MDAAEVMQTAEHIEMLKAELSRNSETISSLRARNVEIAIELFSLIYGISVGDVVCTPDGTEYKVRSLVLERYPYTLQRGETTAKPWITGNPHTKDGIGWDTKQEINLYGNWRKVS